MAASRRQELALLALLSFNFGAIFLDRNALSLLMPFVAPALHLRNVQVGLLSSGIALMWALSGFAITALADQRVPRKRLLIALAVLTASSALLTGFANSFAMLFMWRIIAGLFAGPVLPASQAIMATAAPSLHRGLQMGVMQSFGSSIMASVLAPALLITLALAAGWRAAIWSTAAVGLLSALLMARWMNVPDADSRATVPTAQSTRRSAGLSGLLANHNVRLCNLISVGMVGSLIVGLTFYPLYLVRELRIGAEQMGFLMGTLGISGLCGALLVPYLSDRLGRRPVVACFALVGAIAPCAFLLSHPGPIAIGWLLFISGLAGGTFPLFMAAIPTESLAVRDAAPAIGLIQGVGEGLGGVAMPFLAGALADEFTLRAPLFVLIGCAVAVAIASLWLHETAPAIRKAEL